MFHVHFKKKSSILVTVALCSFSATAFSSSDGGLRCKNGASTCEDLYTAPLGNHGSYTATVKITAGQPTWLSVKIVDFATELYAIDMSAGTINYLKTREGENSEPQTFAIDQPNARNLLSAMRDNLASTAASDHFLWSNFTAAMLNPELDGAIVYLDTLLARVGVSDLANCILSKDLRSNSSNDHFAISGGAYSDLGALDQQAESVWVRSGYRVILVAAPNFDKTAGKVLVLAPLTTQGETSGNGFIYDLSKFEFSKKARSMLCMPTH